MYFDVFHPLPIPPGPFPPSYIPNFMFSLSKIYIKTITQYTYTPKYTSQKPENTRQSIPLSSFCVAQLLWAQGLPWSLGNMPSETLLKETNFYFAGGYQLQIESWLDVGPYVHATLSVSEPVQSLGMLTPPLWVQMCINPVLSGRQFPWRLPSSLALVCLSVSSA